MHDLSDPAQDGEYTLVASGFGGDGRGGVIALRPSGPELLDSVPTVGMACTADRLVRLLHAPGERTSAAELVVYDEFGIVEYRRLDGIVDSHDVMPYGDGWIATSTGTNEIVSIGPDGQLETLWRGPGEPDSWHVNCLTRREGKIWASAFGEFDGFKAWQGSNAHGRGMCFELGGPGRIRGLTHPHSPRPDSDGWLICQSLDGMVTRLDHQGRPTAEIRLGGYTRGMAVMERTIAVGISPQRSEVGATASVVLLDRATLEVSRRIEIPAREVYEVLVVPSVLIEGLRRGFAANVSRLGSTPPGALPAALFIDPSERGQFVCRVAARLPARVGAGERHLLEVEVTNAGSAWLASTGSEPILLASRWRCEPGIQVDGPRAPISVLLAPGQRTIVTLPIEAPDAGLWRLHVSLVREGQYWLDDHDPANGVLGDVVVDPITG